MAGTQVSFLDRKVPAGTYRYRLFTRHDGDESDRGPASSNATVTAPAAGSR